MKKYLLEIKEARGLKLCNYVAYFYESCTKQMLSTYFFTDKEITNHFLYFLDRQGASVAILPLADTTLVEYLNCPEEF